MSDLEAAEAEEYTNGLHVEEQVGVAIAHTKTINGKQWICEIDEKSAKSFNFTREHKKAQWDPPDGWDQEISPDELGIRVSANPIPR